MYKNVAKRALAVLLIFCMVSAMPDFSLLAAAVNTEDIADDAEPAEGETAEDTETEDAKAEDEKETDFAEEEGKRLPEETGDEPETEGEDGRTPFFYVPANRLQSEPSAVADTGGDLTSADIIIESMPQNQIKAKFLTFEDGGKTYVSSDILGLVITCKGVTLRHIKTNPTPEEDGYQVTVSSMDDVRANIQVVGTGIYKGLLTRNYTVLFGKDLGNCTVQFTRPGYNSPSYFYEGGEIKPTVTVKDGTTEVSPSNYDIVWPDDVTNAGTKAVKVKGKSEYAGEATGTYEIKKTNIETDPIFNIQAKTAVYNKAKAASGNPNGITPSELTVTNTYTETAASEADYDVSYSDNRALTSERQKAQAIVEGAAPNCEGRKRASYDIVPASFTNKTSDGTPYAEEDQIKVVFEDGGTSYTCQYTGQEHRPKVKVYQSDETDGLLVENTDYTVEWKNNVDAGTGTVVVTSKGDYYTDKAELSFTIEKYDIEEDKKIAQAVSDYLTSENAFEHEYTGSLITPAISGELRNGKYVLVSGRGDELIQDRDFTVEYPRRTNIEAGAGKIRITGINNCKGDFDVDFVIWKYITHRTIQVELSDSKPQYTGKTNKPVPVVKDNGKTLTEGTDYELEYSDADCIEPGQYTITVKGFGDYYRNDNGADAKTVGFEIVPRKLSSLKAEFVNPVKDNAYTFNGSAFKKEFKIVDKDGTMEISGTALADDFEWFYEAVDENGSGQTSDCKNAGTYQVRIQPKIKSGGFSKYEFDLPDSSKQYLTLPYEIKQKEFKQLDQEFALRMSLTAGGPELTDTPYTGADINPIVSVADKKRAADGEASASVTAGYVIPSTDFEVKYQDNKHKDAGIVTVIVEGRGNYTGRLKGTFRIVKKDLAACSINITIDPDTYLYTGEEIIPDIDTFEIDGRTLDAAEIAREFDIASGAVDASENAYTFTIKGKKNYEGTADSGTFGAGGVKFTIQQQDIASSDVWVEPIPNQAYDEGNAVEPVPVITYNGKELVLGEDFTVTWENNTDRDIDVTNEDDLPAAIIKGEGNFKGTRKVYFHIRESISAADITWGDLEFNYTSRELKPEPTSIFMDGEMLEPETIARDDDGNPILDENGNYKVSGDYKITWKNNINAADADADEAPVALITGVNHYGGTIEKKFTILPIEMTIGSYIGDEPQLQWPLSYTKGNAPMFTGSEVGPTLSILYDVTDPVTGERFQYKLIEGTDYEIISTKGTDAGQRNDLTVLPKGNFKPDRIGMVQLGTYTIQPKPITSEEILISDIVLETPVTKFPVVPEIVLTDTKRVGEGEEAGAYTPEGGTYRLVQNGDYQLEFRNNGVPGMASVTISGVKNYIGSITKNFVIPGSLSSADVKFLNSTKGNPDSGEYYYTGSEIVPQIEVSVTVTKEDGSNETKRLIPGQDYELEILGDQTNCGNPEIRLTGIGAYAGEGSSQTKTFTIAPVDLNDASLVSVNMAPSVEYIGDYINVWPGGNECEDPDNEAAQGSLLALSIVLGRYKLVEGKDFVLEHESDCWRPSAATSPSRTYTLTIKPGTGGNFTGNPIVREYTIGNNFNVDIKFIDEAGKETEFYSAVYTGSAIVPGMIVRDKTPGENFNKELKMMTGDEAYDKKNADYGVTYSDNVNAGTVTVMVYGLGGQDGYETTYCGIRTRTFTITGKDLYDSDVKIGDIDTYVYTSKDICPEPTVTWEGHGDLTVGEEFQYTYRDNRNAGTGYAGIAPAAGNGNFICSRPKEKGFTIEQKNIEDKDVTLEGIPDQVYIGREIEPSLKIYWGVDEVTLTEADYSATFGPNMQVGIVEVTIEGTGNYKGTLQTAFRIVPVNLSDITLEYEKNPRYEDGRLPWTGKQIRPNVTMTYYSTAGELITITSNEAWGCTVTYGANQMIGPSTGSIRLSADANGNCVGDDIVWNFGIARRHIDDPEVEMTGIAESYKLDIVTQECKPLPVLTFTPDAETRYVMRRDADYSVDWRDYDKIGTATVTVSGLNNFDNESSKTYEIANDIADYVEVAEIDPSELPLVYNGKVQHPKLRLKFKLNSIQESTTYTIEWEGECTDAGEYKAVIRAVAGSGYTGQIEIPFEIEKRPVSEVAFSIEPQAYIGSAIKPLISDITAVDEAIGSEPLADSMFEITGYGDNLEIGTEAFVTVQAPEESNYEGTAKVPFEIIRVDLASEFIIDPLIETQDYTGSEIRPEFVISDTRRNSDGTSLLDGGSGMYALQEGEDKDYVVEFADGANKYPGTVTMTIRGVGHYTGTLTKTFNITASLSQAVIAPIPAQPYDDGNAVEPKLTVTLGDKTLTEGEDYRVVYENQYERGTATATIYPVTEDGIYTGSNQASYSISRSIAGAQIRLIDEAFVYTGQEIRPMPSVIFGSQSLTEGEDYTLSYSNNVNAGTARITITGAGGYEEETYIEFTIVPRNILLCAFSETKDQTYTGTPTSQEIVVTDGGRTLAPDVDYTVSYSDHAAPGIATITLSGAGNYQGIKTIRYLINLENVAQVNAKGAEDFVQLSWTAVPGAQGYAVYNADNEVIAKTTGLTYKVKGLNAMTTYVYKIRPYTSSGTGTYYGGFSSAVRAKTSIAKPKVTLKAAKKKIRVSWKRIGGVDGYEIYRSTKKSKGYKKIRTAAKGVITSYTNKKLASRKKYYYKVRAYKKVNGKKVYGKYSSPKSVKAK